MTLEAEQKHAPEFPVVALGASAGGLRALETFFTHMPSDAGIAFIVVQHLSPDHETSLPQLLRRRTEMPVELAQDNMRVIPNRIYVIPPDTTLTVRNNCLRVTPPVEARGLRTPIDGLFRSLAEDRGDNAVCILLSGTGTDGTQGLRAIKEYGGMAMAQTLESAQYDAMLRSAIATGLVDHILPVEAMPSMLIDYATHVTSVNGSFDKQRGHIAPLMNKIHAVLLRRAGHDFKQYKESTIARRLERRMKALRIATVEKYVEALEQQPEEADRLFNDLLIGVTQFFRNPEAFAALATQVIPKVFEGKGADDQVRACVVGCASGEEAYSIAILLFEFAAALKDPPRLQVFATDIDERSLETARRGRYPESIAEQVSPERLERFFISQDGSYQIKRELRDSIIFSNHSFIKDPPFSRLDLLSCRNVMIYLGHELQEKILPVFHYALRPGGYLFLGPAENVTSHQELFRTLDKKQRIFQRKENSPRSAVVFPLSDVIRPPKPGAKPSLDAAEERSLPKKLERIILDRYGPACVTVRENGDAVYFSGRVSLYLEQPSGSPDANVINMAREGLRVPLRAALHKAAARGKPVVQKQISVHVNGRISHVDLTVEPIPMLDAATLYMIVIEEVLPAPQQGETPAFDAGSEEIIRHLESELRYAQENAQSMFEELESANEELKSANEEYQSTNEELESSKEELQSFNEELQTLNSEISRKCAELDHANSDLQNLLDSTQIATIFLDPQLRVKNFTPSAGSVFRLIPGDIGRPITDLAARFPASGLAEDIRGVLKTLVPCERQVGASEDRFFQLRIMPYRTIDNAIDGVVLTFTDVGNLKKANEALQLANEDLKHFSYAASHDLQEPLRMVMSYTQLLARQYKGKLDGQADQYIGYAVAGAERMEALLKGLRDYWSVNDGKTAEEIPVSCDKVLAKVLTDLDLRIRESGAVVTHDPLPALTADEASLTVLLQNLIGNAIKYRREGAPPRIHVSARKNAGAWDFSVRDNGIGIEPQHLETVFAPFKRLHGAEYPGTGIGLAICQKIVTRYRGRIWVESTYGQGSVFHFTIPAGDAER